MKIEVITLTLELNLSETLDIISLYTELQLQWRSQDNSHGGMQYIL